MSTKLRILVLVLLASALAVAGCSASKNGPPEIVEGRTECDECHMTIDDLRFAAAYRLPDGTERRFDDIGDMVTYGQRSGELDAAEVWVFDYGTKEPLHAEDATFVVSDDLVTPMAGGMVAFADPAEAAEMAESLNGETIDWEQVQASGPDRIGTERGAP